ncbi:MAG: hypothetical protein ACKA4D_01175 [Candidatus Karelsulcia muelleri]
MNRIKELSYLNKGLLLILIDKRFYPNKKIQLDILTHISGFKRALTKTFKKFYYKKYKKYKIEISGKDINLKDKLKKNLGIMKLLVL